MLTVGIRELKQRTSELLHHLQASGEELRVTRHGKVVARIVPVPSEETQFRNAEVWAEMDDLTAELHAWKNHQSNQPAPVIHVTPPPAQ